MGEWETLAAERREEEVGHARGDQRQRKKEKRESYNRMIEVPFSSILLCPLPGGGGGGGGGDDDHDGHDDDCRCWMEQLLLKADNLLLEAVCCSALRAVEEETDIILTELVRFMLHSQVLKKTKREEKRNAPRLPLLDPNPSPPTCQVATDIMVRLMRSEVMNATEVGTILRGQEVRPFSFNFVFENSLGHFLSFKLTKVIYIYS